MEKKLSPKELVLNKREKMKTAILLYVKEHGNQTRKVLKEVGLNSLNLSEQELKNKGPEGPRADAFSLAGLVIQTLALEGKITVLDLAIDPKLLPKEKPIDTKKAKKEVREYLYERYVTDDEKKEKGNKKIAKITSLLDKSSDSLFVSGEHITNIRDEIEAKLLVWLEELNPSTPMRLCVKNCGVLLAKYENKKINKQEYNKTFEKYFKEAISLLAGDDFTIFSGNLIQEFYRKDKVSCSLDITEGAQDHGIDAIITTIDNLGFEEKIAIQAKSKSNNKSGIAEKITREFIGSMVCATINKGILITNSTISKSATKVARNLKNVIFIDKKRVLEIAQLCGYGRKTHKDILTIDDKAFII